MPTACGKYGQSEFSVRICTLFIKFFEYHFRSCESIRMAKKKDGERQSANENGPTKDGEEPNFDDPPGFVDNISDEG